MIVAVGASQTVSPFPPQVNLSVVKASSGASAERAKHMWQEQQYFVSTSKYLLQIVHHVKVDIKKLICVHHYFILKCDAL
jgi:hypothetical protein